MPGFHARRLSVLAYLAMNQTDISQAAGRLLREYGTDAEAHVRRRFYDAVSHRNVQGASVWRRILKALAELQRARHLQLRRGRPHST